MKWWLLLFWKYSCEQIRTVLHFCVSCQWLLLFWCSGWCIFPMHLYHLHITCTFPIYLELGYHQHTKRTVVHALACLSIAGHHYFTCIWCLWGQRSLDVVLDPTTLLAQLIKKVRKCSTGSSCFLVGTLLF